MAIEILQSNELKNFQTSTFLPLAYLPTTLVVNFDNCLITIKNVSCKEYNQYGETLYSTTVAKCLNKIILAAKKLAQEISIIGK